MKTTIVNLKTDTCDVYIGRPSVWGNPFKIGRDGNRREVLIKYEEYLRQNKNLIEKLPQLQGKKLGCWCSPKPCHGNIIIKLLIELNVEPVKKGFLR